MKVKRVLLILCVCALALMFFTATAYAYGDQPVSWAGMHMNSNQVLQPYHGGINGEVQLFATGARGHVTLKYLGAPGGGGAGLFTIRDFTEAEPFYDLDQADFYPGTDKYEGADIAEFVMYWANPFYDPEDPTTGPPTLAVKFLWIDFGEPGKADLEQWYIFSLPDGDNPSLHWHPQDIDESVAPWGEPLPVLNGNIQVHVGTEG